jgi:hypothetical protein
MRVLYKPERTLQAFLEINIRYFSSDSKSLPTANSYKRKTCFNPNTLESKRALNAKLKIKYKSSYKESKKALGGFF